MWATFPINAAFTCFSVALPLYVLSIKGNVLDITNLFAVYNLVSIPAFVIWGAAIDRMRRRRFFYGLSFAGCGLVFAAMFLTASIPVLFLMVSLLGVSIAASGPISALLTMELIEKKHWYTALGRLYFIATGGSALGSLVGVVWPGSIPVGYLLLFCSFTSIASLVVTYAVVRDPPMTLEVASLPPARSGRSVGSPSSISSRLLLVVTVPIRSFSRDGVKRAYKGFRSGLMEGRNLLFFSGFFYMTGYAVLNMSYVAFLSGRGVSNPVIFGIAFSNVIFQLGAFALVSYLAARLSGLKLGLYSILLTAFTFGVMGVAAVSLTGPSLVITNLLFFSLSGAGFALWTAWTSLALFSNLESQGQAGVLGSYNALIGLGTVLGSVVSGVISFYVGYSVTFLASSGVLLVSTELLRRASRIMRFVGGPGQAQ
ncbi:MAG: MFS transporter [Thaumarchaeota archaeon]|nr:MFS transporter [Nitrososphaerota archaeon]